MRSTILMLVVLGALVGAFAIFMFVQKEAPTVAVKSKPTTVPSAQSSRAAVAPSASQEPTNSVMGSGDDVWIQQFDQTTGRLTNEFRAARYDPPKEGVVFVDKPESRMYSNNGQVMMISARNGEVVLPEQTKKSDRLDSFSSGPPTRGVLNDVTISMFDDAESTVPSMLCTVPSVSFDNDASRLNTVQAEVNGQVVPADRIPVTVRGRDYDFDGQGLVMRWNQRDQRLEILEIAHGQRLVVKNADAFGAMPLSSAKKIEKASPVQLVSADETDAVAIAARNREIKRQRAAATQRAAAEKASRPPVEEIAYLATFYDNVTINQGTEQIGSAEKMLATFTLEGGEDAADESTSEKPAQPAATGRDPATQPAGLHAPAKPRAEPVTAEKPQAPLEIKWTGKLNIVPVKYADSGLRSLKDHRVEFVGSPVKLQRDGAVVEAPIVSAGGVGNRFAARSNEQFPLVKLIDAGGTKLVAPNIEMNGDVATIDGESIAEMVLNDENGKPQKVVASWKEKGSLHLTKLANGRTVVDSANFSGSVDVNHPQMKLTSGTLAMVFEPAADAGQPALKSVDASGNVHADITGDDGAMRTITGELLSLGATRDTDGKMAINTFKAGGNAVVKDSKQTLAGDNIEAVIAPISADKNKKPGAAQIEKLTAAGNVKFAGEDSTTATADSMSLETRDGAQLLTLMGNPAVLNNAQNRLTGKILKLDPSGTAASIPGPGTLTGLFSASKGKSAEPMTMSWAESFDYDGKKNIAEAVGNILIQSRGSDESIDTYAGRRVQVAFADAATAGESGKPDSLIGKKNWQTIRLIDDVEISSTLMDAADSTKLLRRVNVFVPSVIITAAATGDIANVTAPSGGRMLYEDRAPKDGGVAGQPVAISGATAIEWKKSMVYDAAKNQAVIDGDVVVVHQESGGDPVRMLTQKLISDFQPSADGKTQQLKQVIAGGGATFISPSIRFDAPDAKYDPANDRIVAAGSEGQPVQVFDESGISSGSFHELWWNIKTNLPERMRNVTGSAGR